MTDTSDSQRTEEEIAASVAKLEAETRAAQAQAAVHEAEAEKARLGVEEAELELEKKRHEVAKWRTGEEHHRTYRFSSDVSSSSVGSCLKQLTTWKRLDMELDQKNPMEIVFTSPGGSIYDGFVLFDAIQDLRREGWHITTGTYGMAASMAGVLLQAGDDRWVAESAWVLIHRASFGAAGSSDDIEDMLERVEGLEKRIIEIFVKRSRGRLTSQKIRRNWKRKDWWINAQDCLELGIVDEVRGGLHMPDED